MYIYNAINDEEFKKRTIFHMPGHLGGRGFNGFDITPSMDVTELFETDDLHDPEGVIKESQLMAAISFGAQHAYYMVNGSTGGVLSMVLGFLAPSEKVIADRYSHKSFISALMLSGAEAVWVEPESIDGGMMWGGIAPSDIKKAIEENPDAKAVYITAPNYFGMMSDVKEIARIAHEHGMYLLVDGAHGAHYGMYDKLPPSIISLGADAVCLSLHKTLPALTQSAILLTNKRYERLEAALKTVQSSSPSYLLMSSCEYASGFFKRAEKEPWDKLYAAVNKWFPEATERVGKNVKYKDFSRINAAVSGNPFEAAEKLRTKYNIAVECAYGGGVVAILNSFHKEEEIEKLCRAIDDIDPKEGEGISFLPLKAKRAASVREAFFAQKRRVELSDAAGKIAAQGIMIYPPGICQILPGEMIEKEHIEYFAHLLEKGAKIPGIEQSYCLIFDE